MTVLHNGIKTIDDAEISPTPGGIDVAEGQDGPLMLQDHGNPVEYPQHLDQTDRIETLGSRAGRRFECRQGRLVVGFLGDLRNDLGIANRIARIDDKDGSRQQGNRQVADQHAIMFAKAVVVGIGEIFDVLDARLLCRSGPGQTANRYLP